MRVIPREVVEHALKIRPGSKLVKQRLCCFDKDKRRAIDEEIAKLLVVGFIKKVYHPEWLANPILVRKRVENGECVLTTWVSTKYVQRIHFLCHA